MKKMSEHRPPEPVTQNVVRKILVSSQKRIDAERLEREQCQLPHTSNRLGTRT